MKITYVTHTRFPIQKAHGKQIAEVCTALARIGHQVTLVCPNVSNVIEEDAFAYYGLQKTFQVLHLRHFDATRHFWMPGVLHFIVNMVFYRRALKTYFEKHQTDLLYVRSPSLFSTLLATNLPVIAELHALPNVGRSQFVAHCNRCRKIVCLTTPMRAELLQWGIDAAKVIVEGDGVDLQRFASTPSQEKAKRKWALPKDEPIIGYVGALVTQNTIEKGVRTLIGALALLKERRKKVFGWVVGGPGDFVARYEAHAAAQGLRKSNIRFEGPITSGDVPSALAACDILVYPAPASKHPYFQRDTSPLKLFEYLASDRRIVAADLPPIHDVLDERSAIFCNPGSAQSLSEGIMHAVAENPSLKSKRRNELAAWYTWENRMRRIIDF